MYVVVLGVVGGASDIVTALVELVENSNWVAREVCDTANQLVLNRLCQE